MKLVNTYILMDVLESIEFYDVDCCEKVILDIDPTDTKEIKSLIRYRIYLDFCTKSNEYKETFKQTLKYCLNLKEFDFAEIVFSAYASLPQYLTDYKLFFIWIWEVFYEHEDYRVSKEKLSKYKVDNNDKKIKELKK